MAARSRSNLIFFIFVIIVGIVLVQCEQNILYEVTLTLRITTTNGTGVAAAPICDVFRLNEEPAMSGAGIEHKIYSKQDVEMELIDFITAYNLSISGHNISHITCTNKEILAVSFVCYMCEPSLVCGLVKTLNSQQPSELFFDYTAIVKALVPSGPCKDLLDVFVQNIIGALCGSLLGVVIIIFFISLALLIFHKCFIGNKNQHAPAILVSRVEESNKYEASTTECAVNPDSSKKLENVALEQENYEPLTVALEQENYEPLTAALEQENYEPLTVALEQENYEPLTVALEQENYEPLTAASEHEKNDEITPQQSNFTDNIGYQNNSPPPPPPPTAPPPPSIAKPILSTSAHYPKVNDDMEDIYDTYDPSSSDNENDGIEDYEEMLPSKIGIDGSKQADLEPLKDYQNVSSFSRIPSTDDLYV